MDKEILKKLQLNKEDLIWCSNILDKHDLSLNKNFVTSSNFLDLRQQSIIKSLKNEFFVKYELFGGFPDAERKMLYFIPDYLDGISDYDMVLAEITHSEKSKLSHRDYLGSVLGLGLKREMIGDILVNQNGAAIITTTKIAEFLKANYVKAGKIPVSVEIKDLKSLDLPSAETKTITDTVMSLRLDSAVASCFKISRTQAVKFIESGKVFLNDSEVLKCDKQIKEGDKIILRGKGKAVIKSANAKSKKGRIWLEIERYL